MNDVVMEALWFDKRKSHISGFHRDNRIIFIG